MNEKFAPPPAGFNFGVPPPPSYEEATRTWKLSYVDFAPQRLDSGGFLSSTKYETFDALMNRANAWLLENPTVKVVTAESTEVKSRHLWEGGVVDTDKSTFYEYGESRNYFIRALRLWVGPKSTSDPPEPTQIRHINVVPECIEEGGFFSSPKFETFGQAIERFNKTIRRQPIQGKLLNVETQEMKFHSWGKGVVPDESFWSESGETSTYFLIVIRIFYQVGLPTYEEIGCADFVPGVVKEGGILSHAEFEPLGNVVHSAGRWITQQRDIRTLNVQSIDYKLKNGWGGGTLDTQRSLYRQAGDYTTYYITICRVCYAKQSAAGSDLPVQPPVQLTYKNFLPCQLTAPSLSVPKYETMSQTMKRAMSWLRHIAPNVVAAETVPVRMYTGHARGNPDQTYTWNRGDRSEHWLYVLRVYLDGPYTEPPPEVLPPRPEVVDDGCCTVL